jgi:hypothetical protein
VPHFAVRGSVSFSQCAPGPTPRAADIALVFNLHHRSTAKRALVILM